MPRIDRIRIHNFRGASAPFSLGFAKQKPLVVIFGENGTGKTTIVDALDAVGNGSGGSLTTKSSTTLRTHLPTLGKKPSDMVMEVTWGNTTWTATLGKGGIATTPMPRPPIQVLRRTNLQRFIDSPPGKRYEELRHLIGVDRVEKSEDALKRALDAASQQFDEAARDLSSAEEQLANIWQAEGQPGSDWQSWASEAVRADATDLMQGVERSRRTREAIGNTLRARSVWEQAEAALSARHQALASIEQEVAEGPTLDAAKAMQLVEMLGKVREHLAVGVHDDQCPVCGQDIPLANLQQTIDDRLADLARYEELSKRRRSAQDQLRSAEGVAEGARKALDAAAAKLWEIASRAPEGFAPIEIPGDLRASVADDAAGRETETARSVELIAACEPLMDSLQAEEDAAVQARARVNLIRALLSGAETSRAKTVELETIVKGLTDAYEVMRRARIEFTQRILDEVAQDCNALYAEIHPDEGIAINKIALDEQRRASIHQTMDFGEHSDIAPQAYLSEAHLDTFGFCFWLAFAKREYPNGDAVLVLDDVFSSVDAPHLMRISDLIVKERKHFAQVIITTHQRAWRDIFRYSHGPAGFVDLIELQSWSLAQGVFSYETPLALEELRSTLLARPFNRQAAASSAGVLLEATLDRLTFLYRCSVPRTRENVYTLGELLSATEKLFKKLEVKRAARNPSGENITPPVFQVIEPGPSAIVGKLRQSSYLRNQVGAHHNVSGMTVSDGDVRTFAELAAQLVESIVCPSCSQIPAKSTGTYFRCSCGEKFGVQMLPLQLT